MLDIKISNQTDLSVSSIYNSEQLNFLLYLLIMIYLLACISMKA